MERRGIYCCREKLYLIELENSNFVQHLKLKPGVSGSGCWGRLQLHKCWKGKNITKRSETVKSDENGGSPEGIEDHGEEDKLAEEGDDEGGGGDDLGKQEEEHCQGEQDGDGQGDLVAKREMYKLGWESESKSESV